MTGLPFFEGFAPASMRTIAACMESAERNLIDLPGVGTVPEMNLPALAAADHVGERPINVANLAHETVTAVIAHRDGYRLCFASGTVIHVERGHTFDVAGKPVIEP